MTEYEIGSLLSETFDHSSGIFEYWMTLSFAAVVAAAFAAEKLHRNYIRLLAFGYFLASLFLKIFPPPTFTFCLSTNLLELFLQHLKTVFRIRIRSDPDHLAGSGSASGNVDLDPGTKKNRDKLAYKSTKIIKI